MLMGAIEREQIEKDLLKIIAKLAGSAVEKIKLEDKLKDDLGFDSLKSIEAISRITELYEIDPDMDSLSGIESVKDIVDYLEKQLK